MPQNFSQSLVSTTSFAFDFAQTDSLGIARNLDGRSWKMQAFTCEEGLGFRGLGLRV